MSKIKTLATIALAGCLTLSACGGGASSSGGSPAASQQAAAPMEATLNVAPAFGSAIWGIQLPDTSRQKNPVVTAHRVVVLNGANVQGIDPQGKFVWTTPSGAFPDHRGDGSDGTQPLLRQVNASTVAVVDTSKATGDGLNQDGYAAKVTLLDIDSGTVIKTVTIPGTSSDAPKLNAVGLAFTLPQRKGVTAVLPDGTTKNLPSTITAAGSVQEVDGGATIADHTLALWGSQDGQPDLASRGFAGDGWNSTSLASAPSGAWAELVFGDADHLAIARWVTPDRSAGRNTAKAGIGVIDVASGKIMSTPTCEPMGQTRFTTSPNGQHSVIGPLRLDATGSKAECFGGDPGQKTVNLTAIKDDGTAYGTASAGGSATQFVVLSPDGKITLAPTDLTVARPLGIMDGNVAVHWDPNKAILTGNPIK